MILLVIIAFALIAYFDISVLVKKKYNKELVAYGIFILIAFILNILLTCGVKIPSPILELKNLLDAIKFHY